jgi:hypothetical protein
MDVPPIRVKTLRNALPQNALCQSNLSTEGTDAPQVVATLKLLGKEPSPRPGL